ncbi:MAG: hypothetical protein WC082_08465 [Victivallales bacterium]
MLKTQGSKPDFERVKAALSFEEADRVPNFESFVPPKWRKKILGMDFSGGPAGELAYGVNYYGF